MGTLIAVANYKGNTIKIIERENNCIVLTLRRRLDRANIFSLNFDIKINLFDLVVILELLIFIA
jgi:hypothetical protein